MLRDSVRTAQFDAIPVNIRVSNEAGRIDINTASDQLLLAFLQSQGLSREQSTYLLDNLRQFQSRGGASSRPDRPLQALEELRQIDSWGNERLDCWLDALTVYSQQADVDIGAAMPQTLAAVQWLRAHQGLDPLTARTQPATDEVSQVGGVFRIRASAKVSNDVLVEREWVGRVTGDIHHPALTMQWSSRQDRGARCEEASARNGSK